MIPICPWISSSFPFVPCFSTLIKEKWSSPTAAPHASQCHEYVTAAQFDGDNGQSGYKWILPVCTQSEMDGEVFIYVLHLWIYSRRTLSWEETDGRPLDASRCYSCLSWDQIEHSGHLFTDAAKPFSIPQCLHCVKCALGKRHKSLGHASSLCIVTRTHARAWSPLIRPEDKSILLWWIHYSLMGLFYIVCFG